ncbi:MAG: hypothetical protein SA339_08275 [Methanomassiliicoccus sp.]|nr:hypothetical protein [Methanomassiliicoccus sp.]
MKPLHIAALVIGVVALLIVIIFATLLVVSNANSSGSSGSGSTSDDTPTYVPKANLQIVTSSIDQSVWGDATVTVKVTNTGDAIGMKTIHVKILSGTNSYENTLKVTLAPAETASYDIKVDIPFGTSLDSYDRWLE